MAYDTKTEKKPITDESNNMIDDVLTSFQRSYREKIAKERLFLEVYRRYRSYLEITQSTSRSTLFIPESFKLVETVAPRMTTRKPSFKVLPRASADITQADRIGSLLDYQYDRCGIQQKIKMMVKQGLIYGTSFMKIGWNADDELPEIEPVDIADIFGDPKASKWQNGYIIHRFYKKIEDLKSSKIKYINLDKLELRMTSSVRDDRLRQDRNTIQSLPVEPNIDGIEILEKWYRKDGKVYVCTIADRSILIREEESPLPLDRYPFAIFFDQEVPFEKWGIGEIEPILDLQDEENTTRNQRIDEKNLSIHNMWIVSKLAGIDYQTLVSKPGGIVLANDINGIKAHEKQNITQDSILELNMIKQDIQDTTGVTNEIRGASTGNQTATETLSNTQEANQRFADKINNLEITLKDIGEWMVALNKAFLTSATEIRIVGKYGYEQQKISLKDIRGEYDVDIETGSSLPANPDLRRNQMITLLNTVAPYLINPNGLPEGLRELMRNIIESFDLKNADEILQGAEHPLVNQANATLQSNETDGVNPQMIQAAIKQKLMGMGALNQQQPVQPATVQNGTNPQSQTIV